MTSACGTERTRLRPPGLSPDQEGLRDRSPGPDSILPPSSPRGSEASRSPRTSQGNHVAVCAHCSRVTISNSKATRELTQMNKWYLGTLVNQRGCPHQEIRWTHLRSSAPSQAGRTRCLLISYIFRVGRKRCFQHTSRSRRVLDLRDHREGVEEVPAHCTAHRTAHRTPHTGILHSYRACVTV